MSNLHKRKSEGFTIIEVLIVLAIAGLIMLIVFLAVPALQRSSRNTQRKNDVSSILGAVTDYTNNNGGTLPTSQATLNTAIGNVKLGFFQSANVFWGAGTPPASSTPASTGGTSSTVTTEDVLIYSSYTCGATPTASPVAGSARSFIALYGIEGASGNNTYQCQGS